MRGGYLLKRKIEMSLGHKIEYSELPIHKLQHQMSSSSARASTSYTYGVPGSQVKINLTKGGNHTVTLSRGVPVPAGTPFCKVCYDAGLPVANYTSHYVKDQPGPDGKVVCPTLLAQKCLNCGVPGHTTNYCPEKLRGERERSERDREERERAKKSAASGKSWETVGSSSSSSSSSSSRPRIEDMDATIKPKSKSAAAAVSAPAPPRKTYGGSFGLLCVDETSSSSDEECEQQAGVPKPVLPQRPVLTGPPPAVEPAKPLTWAQRAAAAAQKQAPRPASAAAAPLTDTRFQLHALCERVEMDKRAIAAPKRAAAAAVASESSRKRKQESAMVPA